MSATKDQVYNRWLKDAEPWLQEDDWNSKEYFLWVQRLAEAKANLDNKYVEVDKNVLSNVYHKAKAHEQAVLDMRAKNNFGQVKCWDIAYLIMRQMIAYNFFNRATFEEVPEKSLVKRAQVHLVEMKMPMLDADIAQMLQAAADKVPFEEAVEKSLRNYVEKIRRSESVSTAYNYQGLRFDTHLLVSRLQQSRVNGGPADRSKLPQFFKEVNEDVVSREFKPYSDDVLKNIEAALDTDEKMELFLERCAEPMVENASSDNHAATAIEHILDSPDFKWLINYAAAVEKENLSWEGTLGPALKALKKLGRTGVEQGFDNLAAYAKAHQKPVTV
ncbi:hypothetical protein NW768_011786 [Fusarium equiseti]|uniref:Uncharacterized protein n=1 Tax=Fusarium equiseti TaxID=61235 RepID=A0ABQ8QWP9_FUSEQ|nr:hypothetical protein NW768_011786 [Fusarium equiseti]